MDQVPLQLSVMGRSALMWSAVRCTRHGRPDVCLEGFHSYQQLTKGLVMKDTSEERFLLMWSGGISLFLVVLISTFIVLEYDNTRDQGINEYRKVLENNLHQESYSDSRRASSVDSRLRGT